MCDEGDRIIFFRCAPSEESLEITPDMIRRATMELAMHEGSCDLHEAVICLLAAMGAEVYPPVDLRLQM
jgi:hypothetical protein